MRGDTLEPQKEGKKMVGVKGFEPPAPASRRKYFLLGLTINQPHTHSDPARM